MSYIRESCSKLLTYCYPPICPSPIKKIISYAATSLIFPLQVYAHEKAHNIFTKWLYKNVEATVELYGWGYLGGFNKWKYNGTPCLSSTGELLGESYSRTLISAAGPLADVVTSVALAKLLPKNWKKLAYIPGMGNLLYILLDNPMIGCPNIQAHSGDFCNVWTKGGVLPWIALTATCLFSAVIVRRVVNSQNAKAHTS